MKSPKIIAKALYLLSKKNTPNHVFSALVEYVDKRHMQKHLPNILFHLKRMVDVEKDFNTTNIISAFSLHESSVNKIKQVINADKSSSVSLVVDKSVKGGFIVNYRGFMYDASVKRRLSKLKESLINQE